MTTVLVTGGAGYVGAHACLSLAKAGFTPVAFDNLSNGHARFAQWGPLEVGDVRDPANLAEAFDRHRPQAVLHLAALIEVEESVKRPKDFHETNVQGSLNLIEAARAAGVNALVFSSTCATYGKPQHMPMGEDHPQVPVSPYGETKLAVERALREADERDGFRSICLRYFNAAGADEEGRIGEAHLPETHAIPLAIQAALGERPGFTLFGQDYDTRDGTALRDYVHVLDLADAHVLALQSLLQGGPSDAFNLGSGVGTTVKEMLSAVQSVSGRSFPITPAGRRAGDAPALVANPAKAKAVLGWRPRYDLNRIVETAWRWHAGVAETTAG